MLRSPSSIASFNCIRENYDGYDYNTLKAQPDYFCGFRNPDDELAEGKHPKICNSNADCLTIGGWTTVCKCGFDGNYYCSAEIGSSAFDLY